MVYGSQAGTSQLPAAFRLDGRTMIEQDHVHGLSSSSLPRQVQRCGAPFRREVRRTCVAQTSGECRFTQMKTVFFCALLMSIGGFAVCGEIRTLSSSPDKRLEVRAVDLGGNPYSGRQQEIEVFVSKTNKILWKKTMTSALAYWDQQSRLLAIDDGTSYWGDCVYSFRIDEHDNINVLKSPNKDLLLREIIKRYPDILSLERSSMHAIRWEPNGNLIVGVLVRGIALNNAGQRESMIDRQFMWKLIFSKRECSIENISERSDIGKK